MVKTKIVCTIGPSSREKRVLRKMMLSGMDVVRLNFSHGSHASHGEAVRKVRELNGKYRRRVKILQDLEGHRIRIGRLKAPGGINLRRRQKLLLSNRIRAEKSGMLPVDYSGPLSAIRKGAQIFIDDGRILLTVTGSQKGCLKAEVAVPGVLKPHKGLNIPGAKLNFSGITRKDRQDINFGISIGVDYIAQSFVRNRGDVAAVKKHIRRLGSDCRVIAKIENREGIRNIDAIIDEADGIMIARGDMGVSIPVYEVPLVQKEIIRKCRRRAKPVITATQMLESMTENIRPTRAEVADVSNAVLDGTDMVMLSGETAAGRYPVESVDMMNCIIRHTEKSGLYKFR